MDKCQAVAYSVKDAFILEALHIRTDRVTEDGVIALQYYDAFSSSQKLFKAEKNKYIEQKKYQLDNPEAALPNHPAFKNSPPSLTGGPDELGSSNEVTDTNFTKTKERTEREFGYLRLLEKSPLFDTDGLPNLAVALSPCVSIVVASPEFRNLNRGRSMSNQWPAIQKHPSASRAPIYE